jgi:hypothetical protein
MAVRAIPPGGGTHPRPRQTGSLIDTPMEKDPGGRRAATSLSLPAAGT